ncbi:hypothetical protein ANO14919_022120 [Xylariales sp. No.14919]|nr:hypothetical protein ANO14919_022120 [Xylariales sp. No.14919]
MAPSPPRQEDAQSVPLCEGDTKVIYDVLPEPLCTGIFARIRAEVSWQRMSHQGGEVPRLVAVQGLVEADGSKPVYRHPADESPPLHPFTPAVDAVRAVVERALGHPLNHVLIQLYRAGTDYISEHSDKTLDIARGSFIANVSLGAERTMTLRTKRKPKDAGAADDGLKREVQRARLPHNSLFQMGLATNARWLHGIRQDKRAPRDKAPAELAYDGARISLTFRHIGTHLSADEGLIWGQGARAKTRDQARAVVNGLSDEAIAMLRAFGRENQDPAFVWEDHYGAGFDVLHITAAKRLFLSDSDGVVNLRLRALLADLGVAYARGSLSGGDEAGKHAVANRVAPAAPGTEGEKASSIHDDVPVKFVDNDDAKTVVRGQRDIMLYIYRTYGRRETVDQEGVVAERFQQGLTLLDVWRAASSSQAKGKGPKAEYIAKVTHLLAPWEACAAEAAFIAGPEPSLADFAFWPVLHDIFSSLFSSLPKDHSGQGHTDDKGGEGDNGVSKTLHLPHLAAYYARIQAREAIAHVLGL